MRCESGLSKGLCLICGNNQNSLNDSPSISDNSSQSPPHINHHCCYECGDPLDGIFCHQCTCESCGKGAHYGYNCPPKVLIIHNPEPCNNQTTDELPQTLPSFDPTCYSRDENSFTYDSKSNIVDDSPNVFNPPPQPLKYSYEFCRNDLIMVTIQLLVIDQTPLEVSLKNLRIAFQAWSENIQQKKEEEEKQIAKEDEHLDTISVTESDEFIKSNVENLVPNPSESEGEHEYISKEIYSNPLFDEEIISMKIDPHHFNAESDLIESLLNHDYSIISSSSKIDSLLDEFAGELIFLKLIPPRINKTDCDPEEEIRLIKKLLYDNSSPRPPKEFISENSDAAIKSFSPSPIPVEDSDSFMEEIDLSFTVDDPMPSGIEEDDYDSKRDILILEEFPSNDSLSLPENESFHFDISSSSRPPAKPPDELFASMLVPQGEGSEHPFEPHHTPSDLDEPIHHEQITQSPQHAQITSHEPIPQSHKQTTSQDPTIPSQSHSVITTPRILTIGTIWISQSKVPSPRADETAFPIGDVIYG
nr:hypothetical protein [Tanacetum cinerariifolium]